MPRTPNTVIQFFNVPWDSGYRNLRYFSSASARDTWFDGRSHLSYPNDTTSETLTVEHAQPVKEGVAYTINKNWEQVHNYNYCRYKNGGYTNNDGWIYCFITGWQFASEHSANFSFVRDIWINNVDRFIFPEQFIERETTDTVNDLPEPISINRYIHSDKADFTITTGVPYYFMLASGLPEAESHGQRNCKIDYVDYPFQLYHSSDIKIINNNIEQYATNGTLDRIVGVFCVPKEFVNEDASTPNNLVGLRATTLLVRKYSSYTPKHSKCLRYPYCYLEVSDWTGNRKEYKWENGKGSEYGFEIRATLGISSFVMAQPSLQDNFENSVDLYGVETVSHSCGAPCGYVGNGLENWMAQNSTQIKTQQEQFAIKTGASLVSGVAGGALTGAMVGGVGAVAGAVVGGAVSLGTNIADFALSQNQMMQQADFTPNSVSLPDGATMGLIGTGRMGFFYHSVYPSQRELIALDNYFTKYGYNVSRLGNISYEWENGHYFIKTGGAVVRGNCPQADRDMMMQILDRGVTFWNKDTIGDY